MSEQSPFLIYKIECTLCKTVNEFELIRVGAFTEDGRDTDFSPMNVKWRFPRWLLRGPCDIPRTLAVESVVLFTSSIPTSLVLSQFIIPSGQIFP